MKKDFFDYLINTILPNNKDVYFLSIGLGWPRTDEVLEKFPNQYIQCEASEQTALDIAVGLAYAGKLPILYTIAPFYLRGFETIRTYLSRENLHVIMVGAGRDDEYSEHDGFSHYEGDMGILSALPNMQLSYPNTRVRMEAELQLALKDKRPWYINIRRN